MRGLARLSVLGAVLACAGGLAIVAAAPASAQGSYSPYNETAASALARYVRALAQNPKDFDSLIGAGRASLELGDALAAAGFFARADEVNPQSPLPEVGMGAVQVANGDGKAAMPYFTRAQQLGATPAMLGCDRGLAYDLLGQQAKAQTDYRAALTGPDADEARRRLALSLAISGDKANAIATLAPLSAKGDATTNRVRAFVLALTGDPTSAKTTIDAAMPGSWASVAPFLQRLSSLPAGEKAAAVNLGIFPDSTASQTAYPYAAPTPNQMAYAPPPPVEQTVYAAPPPAPAPPPASPSAAQAASTGRLAGIDALLNAPPAQAPSAQPAWEQPALQSPPPQPQVRPVQVAYVPELPRAAPPPRVATASQAKIWLQLESGQNEGALSRDFKRLKARNPDLFEGITGYVVQSPDRVRLVIGPFRGPSDANIFSDDLHDIGVDAFRWSNSAIDRIVPIAVE